MPTEINVLDRASECFQGVRQNLIAGAGLLYKIKTEELWKGDFESFSEYLEEKCKISDSFASKLVQVWKGFVVEGGFSHAKLETIDPEKLYLALKLDAPVEKQLASATTLTRQELKDELREDEFGEHDHKPKDENRYAVCECSKWFKV